VNPPTDPVTIEFGCHRGPVFDANHREVVNGFAAGCVATGLSTVGAVDDTGPSPGGGGVRIVQVGELDRQDGRLQGVQPAVASALVVTVPVRGGPTVIRAPPDPGSEIGIPGDDRTTIAQRAQVLTRIEAEGRRVADAAGAPSAQPGAMRLRGVLDQGQTISSGHGNQGVDVGHLTEQVHRDDRGRSRARCGRHRVGVNQQRVGQHVDEPGARPNRANRFGGRDKGVGGHDDLVARTDPQVGEDKSSASVPFATPIHAAVSQ